MSRVSGIEISSSQGLKKPPKIIPSLFIPGANFKGFFNPRDEEISIPETNGPFGNCIPELTKHSNFFSYTIF